MQKSPVFLIVGLGNPGEEYKGTRHNLGFQVVDEIGKRLAVNFRVTRNDALVADVQEEKGRLLLMKPQTFMNNSGQSVRTICDWFDIPVMKILILHDDIDLPFGTVRLKESGGSAGHKGIQSVIDKLGSDKFKRLRIGLGRPPGKKEPSDFVLEPFVKNEMEELEFTIHEAADIAQKIADNSL